MANIYQNVTDRILASLEAGIAPWVKPWSATAGRNVPLNVISGKPYQGVNAILLWGNVAVFKTPHYLTYKQALDLGGHVRKGEHGFQICKVLQLVSKSTGDAETDEARAFTTMKFFTVFNVDQCEGLPARVFETPEYKPQNSDERDATIDEFIAATGADYRDGKGGDRAFYSPSQDFVAMPGFDAFKSAAHYYSTAFHELGHWTGHAKRLDRDFSKSKRFGDKAYAAEELVAELTSAFLCAEFSIDGNLQHADYIGSWIRMLKDDAKAFFTAASAAQKAAHFLRDKALADDLPIAA